MSRSGQTQEFFADPDVRLGRRFLFLALAAALIGMILSLMMRLHLNWPNSRFPILGLVHPEDYLAWMSIHGTLMIFFVLTVAPFHAFGTMITPGQVGARRMAFPSLNAAAFWIILLSLVVLLASLFVPGGASNAGWTQYPPLSAIPDSGPGQGLGTDLWIASIALFCLGSMGTGICIATTSLQRRAPGMTLMRMPLTAWGWLITSVLVILSFSILLVTAALLFADRHLGTSFFEPAGLLINGVLMKHAGGQPLMWQHLFWFFGHPEVYIAVLPAMGITSHLLANFARRPVFGYRGMVIASFAIAILGFAVWGHHMFVSGMNPYSGMAFASLSMVISIPSAVKTFHWMATLWGGRIRMETPMLFTLGFISLFITGGLTGPVLAQPVMDAYLHDTYFVVAHFHLIMGMAVVFALFAATYFWFPLMFGKKMNNALGKTHFWISFAGAYLTFIPMHFLGLAGQPRRYSQIIGSADYLAGLSPLHKWITFAALFLAAGQLIFVVNFFWSIFRGQRAEQNPWKSTTLEWIEGDRRLLVRRGAYEFFTPSAELHNQFGRDFIMQTESDSAHPKE